MNREINLYFLIIIQFLTVNAYINLFNYSVPITPFFERLVYLQNTFLLLPSKLLLVFGLTRQLRRALDSFESAQNRSVNSVSSSLDDELRFLESEEFDMVRRRLSTTTQKMKVHFSVTSTAAQAQPAEMFVVASTKNELGGLRSLLVTSINQTTGESNAPHHSRKPMFMISGKKGPMHINKN